MTTSHESEKAPMETTVKPSSLAQVANSQAAKSKVMGQMELALKPAVSMRGLVSTMPLLISI